MMGNVLRLFTLLLLLTSSAAAAAAGDGPRRGPPGRADPAPAADLRPYQRLLDDYVQVVEVAASVLETRFDYRGLLSAGDREERLARATRAFERAPLGAMAPAERLAFAINAYNYFAIVAVLEGLESTGGRLLSILDVGAGDGRVFKEERLTVADRTYSLDDWEREHVFFGFERGQSAPPPRLDPRAHFAVHCASVGCPTLLPEALEAARLQEQLTTAARNALANPRHLRIDPDRGVLRASSLFGWYQADFEAAGGVLEFIKTYGPPEVVELIDAGDVQDVIADLPWDWSLNDVRGTDH